MFLPKVFNIMKMVHSLAAALAASVLIPSVAMASNWLPVIELEGNGLSDGSSGALGIFSPITLDSGQVLFLDAQARLIEGGLGSGSLGFGFRQTINNGTTLGVYGYYDYLHSKYGNNFNQFSFGAEAFNDVFEARANVYLPQDSERTLSAFNEASIIDGRLMFREGKERALRGGDIEAGIKLPIFSDDSLKQFKVVGGGYYYEGKNTDDILGGKLRAELSFSGLPGLSKASTLSVGVTTSYDNQDKLKGGVYARLRLPFGAGSGNKAADDAATRRVERNNIIRTHSGATGDLEAAVFSETGEVAGKVVTISGASGDAAAVNKLLAETGKNGLVLTNGDLAYDATIALGTGQYLLGGGGSLSVRGANSGGSATFTNHGAATKINGNKATVDVISMASGSTVSSLAITGGLAGIGASNATGLNIHNVDISRTGGDGIRVNTSKNVTISDTNIHDLYICENNTTCEFSVMRPNRVPYAGISALGTSDLTVKNTTISNVTYGVFAGAVIDDSDWPTTITSKAENIRLDNVTVTNSRREGLLLVAANKVEANKVTIDNSTRDLDMDLVVLQGTSNVNIRDMVLKGGVNGLMLVKSSTLPAETSTSNVVVDGLTIIRPRNSGVFFNPVSDIHLKNVSIRDAGNTGIFLYGSDWEFLGGPVKNVSFENVSVDGAKNAGVNFAGPVKNVSGDIRTTNVKAACSGGGDITQDAGSVLTLNGTELNKANFKANCLR